MMHNLAYYSKRDADACMCLFSAQVEWERVNPEHSPEPIIEHGAGPAPPRERRSRLMKRK